MRDLNLGPDSKRLVDQFNELNRPNALDTGALRAIAYHAQLMSSMLHRWITICWCWQDNCPANICGGPHVTVVYHTEPEHTEAVEHYAHVGNFIKGVEYHVKAPE